MKRTAFYDNHRDLGGRMVEFAGWEMPVQYSSIRREHIAVRKNAGIFDVSHMGDFYFRGKGASDFISGLLPYDYTKLEPGKEFYTHILNDRGIILDDTIVMRLADDEYLMVPNAATTQKIHDHIAPLVPDNVIFEDRSNEDQCIALQGPKAQEILSKLTDFDLSTIQFFEFATVNVPSPRSGDHAIIASASGYTGEAGYELYTDRAFGSEFWDMLMNAGREFGIEPCGLGSRDTLRLEKGFLLSGTDFNDDRTTLETGCDWAINWDHDFIGKDALMKQKETGGYELFTGFVLQEKGIPRHDMPIQSGGKPIGRVTSGTLSPMLDVGIALGYVDPAYAVDGTEVEILIRGSPVRSLVKKPPFV